MGSTLATSTSRAPGSSRSSSATGSTWCRCAGSNQRNVVQIADPGGAGRQEPTLRPSPGAPQPRGRLHGRADPRRPRRPPLSAPPSSTSTSRRCAAPTAAPHYFFGAAYFDRLLPAERTWLALATDPDGRPRRRLDRRGQRRLPALLPERQRRFKPRRLADEERPRPPDRTRRGAANCRSTSAAASAPATRSRSSSAATPTAPSPGAPPRSICRPRPLRRAHRRPRGGRLLPRLPRSACAG